MEFTKICTKCGKEKPIKEFYRHEYHKDKHTTRCKQCILLKQAEYRNENREIYNARARLYHHKNKNKQRNGKLKHNYNLTLEQKQRLYVSQNSRCAICYSPIEFNKICVDHDHITRKIRGLLCSKCNFAIGLFNHSPINLISARIYLEKI